MREPFAGETTGLHGFEARLEPHSRTATYITVPLAVSGALGGKARIPVRGTVNGAPFRSSITPTGNGGPFYMVVNRDVRGRAGVMPGEIVRVTMERDDEPRSVVPPEDLVAAWDDAAARAYDALAYSHRKEYVEWIGEAKREETRRRRIEKAAAMLREGRTLRSSRRAG